jgi:hypothetical protein
LNGFSGFQSVESVQSVAIIPVPGERYYSGSSRELGKKPQWASNDTFVSRIV